MNQTDKLTTLIQKVAQDLGEQLNIKELKEIHAQTPLYGKKGSLKSVELINFIADLESALEEAYGKPFILANDQVFSQHHSPFQDITTLAKYIETQIIS